MSKLVTRRAFSEAQRFLGRQVLFAALRSASSLPQLKPIQDDDEREISEVYNYLRTLPGGSVDLDLSLLDEKKIAKIIINQPKKRNAFSGAMFCQLLDVVRKLEDPEIAAKCSGVLLMGKSGTFCSGADLNYVRSSLNKVGGWRMSRIMQYTFSRFSVLPYISATLLEGFAVCGGAELAAWSDFRLADPNAKVIFVQARRGLTTAWGGTFRLAQILGPKRTLQTLVTSRTLTANAAHELGFVDLVLPISKPDSQSLSNSKATAAERAATDWMIELCSHTDPSVVQSYKRTLQLHKTPIAGYSTPDLLKFEREEFLRLWATPYHLAKFNEQFLVKKS